MSRTVLMCIAVIANNYKGVYIKDVGGEASVSVWAAKLFGHVLMGHENFLKNSDGSQIFFF